METNGGAGTRYTVQQMQPSSLKTRWEYIPRLGLIGETVIHDARDQGGGPHRQPRIMHTETTMYHRQERTRATSGIHSIPRIWLATPAPVPLSSK